MKNMILKLRKINNFSQDELAKKIGISRPTLVALEKGKRDVTLGELKKISIIFDVPIEMLLNDTNTLDDKIYIDGFSQYSSTRFRQLIISCIHYGSGDDGKITKTKLAKLVYLCDFASYYTFLSPISGFEYRKLAQGPVAIQFFDIIDNDQSLVIENKGRSLLVSLLEPAHIFGLKKEELALVESVCKKWRASNTQEIVDFTHHQIPWKICRYGEVIPYCLIHNESPDNVY